METATQQAIIYAAQRSRFGAPPPWVETEEQFLKWWLEQLQTDYLNDAKWAQEQLFEIEKSTLLKPVVMPLKGSK